MDLMTSNDDLVEKDNTFWENVNTDIKKECNSNLSIIKIFWELK